MRKGSNLTFGICLCFSGAHRPGGTVHAGGAPEAGHHQYSEDRLHRGLPAPLHG